MKFQKKRVLFSAVGFVVLFGLLGLSGGIGGCNNSGSGGSGGNSSVSTDATTNEALITSFIAGGDISGTWTNNNFGSSGDIGVISDFDETTKILTITVDIDGGVFGGADPDPETFQIDMSDFIQNGTTTLNFSSDTYGDISATVSFLTDGTGTFSATATNIPAGATSASLSGRFSINNGIVSFQQDSLSFQFGGQTITVTSTFN